MSTKQPRTDAARTEPDALLGYLTFFYALLILYGSLFPLTGWTTPAEPLFRFLVTMPELERADIVQNVLVYAPLGLLLTLWLHRQRSFAKALLVATVAGTALSFFVESVQQFLPSRVASLSDLAMNFLGTALGGLLGAALSEHTFSGKAAQALRDTYLWRGPAANLILAVLGLWVLSQTSPFVPSLDIAHLRHGLAPLKEAVLHPELFDWSKFAVYLLNIVALGILALDAVKPHRPALPLFYVLVAIVLLSKVVVVTRQLAPEALCGAMAACLALLVMYRAPRKLLAVLAGVALIVAFSIAELTPVVGAPYESFNWIPFLGQMQGLNGLTDILELLWPTMALACLCRAHVAFYRRDAIAFIGGLATLVLAFGEEWYQQYLPGRYGDLTQVLIALAGWVLPWCVREAQEVDE
jgi:VanZ family protein